MKDLIEKILKYLPNYLTDFAAVFGGPKRFIEQKNINADDTFHNALLFLAVSLVVVVLMTAPLLPPGKELWAYLVAQAVTTLVAVSLFALALRLSWRVVGGRATFRSFFVTYAYYFGVIFVLLTLWLLLGSGILKVGDPALYAKLRASQVSGQRAPELLESTLFFVYLGVLGVGFILSAVWGFIGWGAYRQLNGLGKGRSFVAMMISGAFGWLIAVIIFVLGRAMQ